MDIENKIEQNSKSEKITFKTIQINKTNGTGLCNFDVEHEGKTYPVNAYGPPDNLTLDAPTRFPHETEGEILEISKKKILEKLEKIK